MRTRVLLPDGTSVTGVSLDERRENDLDRDFGLYLDHAWQPTWNAVVVDWPDYGVPDSPEDAIEAIVAAFDRARQGARVEVGCLGGHGRTGTVLACFAVLTGLAARDAIRWVRQNYDVRAIENGGQEDWVIWFASRLSASTPPR